MRISFAISWTLLAGAMVSSSLGQDAVRHSTAPRGSAFAAAAPRFTYVLFWKQQDAATQQFAETLQSAAEARADRASWSSIDIKDPANRAAVDHYGVSRAPMPLAICVADNGAVTGVFPRRPSDQMLERALVTPAMTEVTKGLQDKKIVVVHVQPAAQTPLPGGAAAFVSAPDFAARTMVVDVVRDNPEESRFLADMKISAQQLNDSTLVVMAPPGVLVGKFDASATMEQIAAKLHAAGKCCNDPNCKHNQKAQ